MMGTLLTYFCHILKHHVLDTAL